MNEEQKILIDLFKSLKIDLETTTMIMILVKEPEKTHKLAEFIIAKYEESETLNQTIIMKEAMKIATN